MENWRRIKLVWVTTNCGKRGEKLNVKSWVTQAYILLTRPIFSLVFNIKLLHDEIQLAHIGSSMIFMSEVGGGGGAGGGG